MKILLQIADDDVALCQVGSNRLRGRPPQDGAPLGCLPPLLDSWCSTLLDL
jgi:hypothetical protein